MEHITNEIWREVAGYEGLYQVSNLGRVKGLKKNIIRSPFADKDGYYGCVISKDSKLKTHKIHRLVAQAYPEICGEWFEGCVIDHINGERKDNRAENLRVTNVKDNNNNPITRERAFHTTRNKSVAQYDNSGVLIRVWESLNSIQRELGFKSPNIGACCRGVTSQSHGYKWRYYDN